MSKGAVAYGNSRTIRALVRLAAAGAAVVAMSAGIASGADNSTPGAVKMEVVKYGGWPNCVRLSNGAMELIVTTDVGPRVIRCGFVGGKNLLKEFPGMMGASGGDQWRIYGGHRLWHAPEEKPRTYHPDNAPIEHSWNGSTLTLRQPAESTTGIAKEIEITLDPKADHVTLRHRLINRNLWEIETAPWCLSVMEAGGRAIMPQEPFVPFPDALLPARPMVLWTYTDMTDPRWRWGARYIQLSQDAKAKDCQKIGLRSTPAWGAYVLDDQVFLKTTTLDPKAQYPDFGCSWEIYTNSDMLELETLGPVTKLAASGGSVEHVEHWNLFKAAVGTDETEIAKVLEPLVKQAKDRAKD